MRLIFKTIKYYKMQNLITVLKNELFLEKLHADFALSSRIELADPNDEELLEALECFEDQPPLDVKADKEKPYKIVSIDYDTNEVSDYLEIKSDFRLYRSRDGHGAIELIEINGSFYLPYFLTVCEANSTVEHPTYLSELLIEHGHNDMLYKSMINNVNEIVF